MKKLALKSQNWYRVSYMAYMTGGVVAQTNSIEVKIFFIWGMFRLRWFSEWHLGDERFKGERWCLWDTIVQRSKLHLWRPRSSSTISEGKLDNFETCWFNTKAWFFFRSDWWMSTQLWWRWWHAVSNMDKGSEVELWRQQNKSEFRIHQELQLHKFHAVDEERNSKCKAEDE